MKTLFSKREFVIVAILAIFGIVILPLLNAAGEQLRGPQRDRIDQKRLRRKPLATRQP